MLQKANCFLILMIMFCFGIIPSDLIHSITVLLLGRNARLDFLGKLLQFCLTRTGLFAFTQFFFQTRTRVWKNNCVNANNPEKHTKAKNAVKQGNAGERPDAAARYTVKSSGANSLLFILHRYLPADKLRGSGCLPQWGRCHGVTEGLVWRKSRVIA